MIGSKCVGCGSKKFEHRLTKVDEIPLSFIQCTECGGVVGVLEHERSIDNLREIYQKLIHLTELVQKSSNQ